MKKRFLAAVLAAVLALGLWPVTALAAGFPPEDSAYWSNVTLSAATDAITKIKSGEYRDNVVLVYYRDTCGYSRRHVPELADFAQEAKLHMIGYNDNSEGSLNAIWRLGLSGSLSFPIVAVYNASTGDVAASDGVFGVDDLTELLNQVGLYGEPAPSKKEPEKTSASPTERQNDDSISQSEWDVLRYTNQHRVEMGLRPLTMYSNIQKVGNQRAWELKAQFSHDRPDGSGCFTAFSEYGVSYFTAAENIAMGYGNARSVVNGWLNSSGHRANIETAELTHIGVGHEESYNAWVQVFSGERCKYSGLTLSASTLAVSDGDLESALERSNLTANAQCSSHGRCSLPVIAGMCSGYDPQNPGEQKVTVALGDATAVFTVSAACSEHSYDSGKVLEAPTCWEKGEKVYTCLRCGHQEREEMPMTEHDFDGGYSYTRTNATCTEAGVKVLVCGDCGERKEVEIPALGHKLDSSGFCTVCWEQVENTPSEPETPDPETPDPVAPTLPGEPTTPKEPEPVPASGLAYASTQRVEVDGVKVRFEMYALKDSNGYDTNYIKARDLAFRLYETEGEFEVLWDGAVKFRSHSSYTPDGSEMWTPFTGNRSYTRVDESTYVDGEALHLQAIRLTDDKGGGYTYYKLRDLGEALGFNVSWSAERGVYVETDKPYQG